MSRFSFNCHLLPYWGEVGEADGADISAGTVDAMSQQFSHQLPQPPPVPSEPPPVLVYRYIAMVAGSGLFPDNDAEMWRGGRSLWYREYDDVGIRWETELGYLLQTWDSDSQTFWQNGGTEFRDREKVHGLWFLGILRFCTVRVHLK